MDQLRLKGPGLKRHKQRVSIYASTYAKLEVKPGGVLETCYGDVPPELVELVASYLHPRDVARMRSVSSGWRQHSGKRGSCAPRCTVVDALFTRAS